jgi:hypothetical protein
VNTSAAVAGLTISVVEYSGVQRFGTPPSTISLTTHDANNFCVAGFAEDSGGTISATTGILETSGIDGAGGAFFGAIVDNSQATAGSSCTDAVSNTGVATDWAYASVELRSVGPAAVDVVDVTNDPVGVGTASLTVVTSILEPDGSLPSDVGRIEGLPNPRAYVSFEGTNQFDVLDNTVAVPVQIAGAPFNLPDPTMAATGVVPVGVVIPVTTGTPTAYFMFQATGVAGIIVNGTPPTIGSPTASVALLGGAGSGPTLVRAIPIPK